MGVGVFLEKGGVKKDFFGLALEVGDAQKWKQCASITELFGG